MVLVERAYTRINSNTHTNTPNPKIKAEPTQTRTRQPQTCQAIKKATGLPQGLLQAMVALHDALFLLGGVDGEALQAAIAKV